MFDPCSLLCGAVSVALPAFSFCFRLFAAGMETVENERDIRERRSFRQRDQSSQGLRSARFARGRFIPLDAGLTNPERDERFVELSVHECFGLVTVIAWEIDPLLSGLFPWRTLP